MLPMAARHESFGFLLAHVFVEVMAQVEHRTSRTIVTKMVEKQQVGYCNSCGAAH